MRHLKQTQKRLMPRVLLIFVLVVMITVGSVVTVMANTAEITVVDGENTYTFSMMGTKPEDILARAQTEGMPAVSEIDAYDFSELEGILTVHRSVRLSVTADGVTQLIVVPKGTQLADALAGNGITLGARDITTPAADTALDSDTQANITRSNRVFVSADGARSMVDVQDGTVKDALSAAGVKLGKDDAVTPALDEPLTNGMRIRVARFAEVTVTADGMTNTCSVTAHDAAEAVENSGVTLGADDRLLLVTEDGETEIGRETPVEDGASIRVVRIRYEELVLNEVIEYETKYEDDDSMYEGETRTKVEGVEGEKRVTYKVTYADGEEESRRPIGEEILKEAEEALVLRGTTARYNGASTGAGTFTDASGNVVDFQYSLYGSCTAYYAPPDAITSIGAKPQVGYVAVDPNIIPYGSLLYITSPYGDWDYGYCYAMDTGGAAMCGDIVADLYYDTFEDCSAFGRRNMNVYVIRAGWGD